MQARKQYLEYWTDASFQGVNRLFVLSFENNAHQTRPTGYFLPAAEIRNYNTKIDWKNFFNQPVGNSLKTFDNILKFVAGQGYDYTNLCLLDYPYFIEH